MCTGNNDFIVLSPEKQEHLSGERLDLYVDLSIPPTCQGEAREAARAFLREYDGQFTEAELYQMAVQNSEYVRGWLESTKKCVKKITRQIRIMNRARKAARLVRVINRSRAYRSPRRSVYFSSTYSVGL